jgi:hypothetical protein
VVPQLAGSAATGLGVSDGQHHAPSYDMTLIWILILLASAAGLGVSDGRHHPPGYDMALIQV